MRGEGAISQLALGLARKRPKYSPVNLHWLRLKQSSFTAKTSYQRRQHGGPDRREQEAEGPAERVEPKVGASHGRAQPDAERLHDSL